MDSAGSDAQPCGGMLERHKQELSVVAVNDMADLHTNAHLFRYDSTYGAFPGKVEVGEGGSRSMIGTSWC